jgi:hypothetical protein
MLYLHQCLSPRVCCAFYSSLRYVFLFLSSSALQLLHTACFNPHESHSTAAHISYVFYVFILYVHLMHTSCRNSSACSSLCHCSSLQVVHYSSSSLLHSLTIESLHFSVMHSFLTSSHLLVIMATLHLLWRLCSMRSSSEGIMLRFLRFSASKDSSSSLSVTASQLWILWLLSPFLRVTTSDDQALIQKALPDLHLLSTSFFSQYDIGL